MRLVSMTDFGADKVEIINHRMQCHCHSRESGNPWSNLLFCNKAAEHRDVRPWIPACAGMTKLLFGPSS
jgi:hypothetical protein